MKILLVEDSPTDAEMAIDVLEDSGLDARVEVVTDGECALEALRAGGGYDLVLLDLNLPRLSGVEVLVEVRRDEALRDVPVIVLTTSEDDRDIVETHDLQADGYLSKPLSPSQLEFEYLRALRRREA